jgi:hypothetical protein
MDLRANLVTEIFERFGIKLCSIVHSYDCWKQVMPKRGGELGLLKLLLN